MNGIGISSAHMGLESAMKWATEIDATPLFQIRAWKIRKLYHLWQGNSREAKKCQEHLELLQIQNSPGMPYKKGTDLYPELRVYCLSDDLSGIKQMVDVIEKMAERSPHWAAALHYARGEYQRIRGDYKRALREFRKAFEIAAPDSNQNWAFIANGYLRTLNALGRHGQAVSEGRRFFSAAQEQAIRFFFNFIRLPLAIAEAKEGNGAEAIALTGVIIFVINPSKELKRPIETVETISRLLFDAGDVARVFVAA